jgi:hypothetical protein
MLRIYVIFLAFNRLLLRIVMSCEGQQSAVPFELEAVSAPKTSNDEGVTQKEAARTNWQPGSKWPMLAAVAFLILVELGGMILRCYRCDNPTPVPVLQGR